MVLTFDGTVAPAEVKVGYIRCTTRRYLPNPMQCFNCFRFGHTKQRCDRQQPTCRNCSREHELSRDENGRETCTTETFCRNCQGGHQPTARECPRYKEEEMTILIKAEEDVSMAEARKRAKNRLSNQNSSFAEAVANSTEIEQLKGEIRNLHAQMLNYNSALAEITLLKEQAETNAAELQEARVELQRAKTANQELATNNANLKDALKAINKGKQTDGQRDDTDSDMHSACSDIEPKNTEINEATSKTKLSKAQKKALKRQNQANPEQQQQGPAKKATQETNKTPSTELHTITQNERQQRSSRQQSFSNHTAARLDRSRS